MSKEEKKLKAKVDEYFEKYMCVSFDKFIENWEDLERYSKEQDKILQQKENIIKEVREDLDKQIEFCTNEANGTTNDKYCRIAINYLKHLKDKLDKGE